MEVQLSEESERDGDVDLLNKSLSEMDQEHLVLITSAHDNY